MVRLVVDTHVHLYPCYDLGRAINAAFVNLATLSKGCPSAAPRDISKAICLTESAGCHVFRDLLSGERVLPPEYDLCRHSENLLVISRNGGNDVLLVVAGRQIITAERLEILALGADVSIADGTPILEAQAQILAASAVPVLPWALGKWWFRRALTVQQVLKKATPETLVLGDTNLRPQNWSLPYFVRRGTAKGLRFIAGSDPLPFAGEEAQIGTYGIIGDRDLNWRDPVATIRDLLLGVGGESVIAGQRNDRASVRERRKALKAGKSVAASAPAKMEMGAVALS